MITVAPQARSYDVPCARWPFRSERRPYYLVIGDGEQRDELSV
jgi:hypothetical protein